MQERVLTAIRLCHKFPKPNVINIFICIAPMMNALTHFRTAAA